MIDNPTCVVGSAPKWLASMSNQFASSTTEELSTNILFSSSDQSTTVRRVSDLASIIVVDEADAG